MAGRVDKLLEDARRKLVETGSRNRLIHANRANKRAISLNIVNRRSEDLFEMLRLSNRRMRFKELIKDADEDQDELPLFDFDYDCAIAGGYQELVLWTPYGPSTLQRRLLRLFTDSKTAEEEQGVNILYLALGFLVWFEDKASSVQRESPLILLPVELVRNERGSTFDLRARDDDIVTNMPLRQRLWADFNVTLPEIEESDNWSPSSYFAAVRDAIGNQSSWSIDEEAIQLGFFSFSKLLMLRDLHPDTWSGTKTTLNDHPLIQRLLLEGFSHEEPLFGDNEKLDQRLDPSNIIQVVDADSSQTRVIEEVRAGRNLIVQGPPGTGKSQTITNIIAAAVYDGKSVLFVAEKMAALKIVHDRLVKAGLRDICLELHSRNANKKAVVQELGRTLTAGLSIPGHATTPDALRKSRDQLNRIADLLHRNVPGCDFSPFSAMAEISGFFGRRVPPPTLRMENLHLLTNAQRDQIVAAIANYVETLQKAGTPEAHPFSGTRSLDLQPTDLQRLADELNQVCKAMGSILNALKGSFPAGNRQLRLQDAKSIIDFLEFARSMPDCSEAEVMLFLSRPDDQALGTALHAGQDWQSVREKEAALYTEAALTFPLDDLRTRIYHGVCSFWSRLFGGYREASRALQVLVNVPTPKEPEKKLALIDTLLSLQRIRATLAQNEALLSSALGGFWRGESTDFTRMISIHEWVQALRSTYKNNATQAVIQKLASKRQTAANHKADWMRLHEAATVALRVVSDRLDLVEANDTRLFRHPLEDLHARFTRMSQEIHRYSEWVSLERNKQTVISSGLLSLIESLEKRSLPASRATDEFLYALAESRWTHARRLLPELTEVAQSNRDQMVKSFCHFDRKHFTDVQKTIHARHLEQLPKGAAGEMGFIRGEIGKTRGHKSIRRLMEAAGRMVCRIKPVFLMSPISVAQFLPVGSLEFDMLVIDEASQVRPEDALGAIARVKQLVVVGDQKQLPPTSFFDRLSDNAPEEEADEADAGGRIYGTARATELESILTLCQARGIRSSMLRWHYRSKDPSLIQVSNHEFYENQLILPPSPRQMNRDYGLKFTRVAGVYIPKGHGGGRPGTNRIEAEQIATAVAKHARDWPTLSLGVVAFSRVQSDMITEVLEIRRRKDEVLDSFLREGKVEDAFVKNIENVQGDERDVILISVGYGPHEPNGVLASMNFGPVNGEGGPRRLNVLFSRARIRCEVFASFDPSQIDLNRTQNEGPQILKRFLEFAKSGILDEQLLAGGMADSPFESDVASVIAGLGYQPDLQVGSAGFRIDIGVRHPETHGHYILAVECDGATWHSAIWARERDRLRQDVLEGLGWNFHRIWSTDWFQRRESEISRLKQALEDARTTQTSIALHNASNKKKPDPLSVQPVNDAPVNYDALKASSLKVPPYRKSDVRVSTIREPHEVSPWEMAGYVSKVVQVEGPIHTDEVVRRIVVAFGKQRSGARIDQAVLSGLREAEHQQRIISEGPFWLLPEHKEKVPIRDRASESAPTTRPEYLAPLEILAAARMIEAESGSVGDEELVRSVARLLGFARLGRDLNEWITQTLANRSSENLDAPSIPAQSSTVRG
ncbi:hypothetical protein SIID45300_01680 [Candidatus Magnetaquicoccaceae bacterium FCR-1]|uniref:DNA helicase n=1 Tax=Candidatus Magnetaquiglobus chichijimensis TaxID=3141448 RepID=A0ABQ0C8Z1_9PROT